MDGVRFDVDTSSLDPAVRHLSGFGIRALTSNPPTLEELFLRHYGDEVAEPVDQPIERAADQPVERAAR